MDDLKRRRALVTYRSDQEKTVRRLTKRRQLSRLFEMVLDVVEEGQADWTERFKKRVAEEIDIFQVGQIKPKK